MYTNENFYDIYLNKQWDVFDVCSDGTATGGSSLSKDVDYIQTSGTLEFKHQETSKTIEIKINKEAKVGSQQWLLAIQLMWCNKYIGFEDC